MSCRTKSWVNKNSHCFFYSKGVKYVSNSSFFYSTGQILRVSMRAGRCMFHARSEAGRQVGRRMLDHAGRQVGTCMFQAVVLTASQPASQQPVETARQPAS